MTRIITAALVVMIAASVTAAPHRQLVGTGNEDITSTDGNLDVGVKTEPAIAQIPFAIAVAEGRVDGYSSLNKYGRAVDGIQTTPTDVWDLADATPTQQIWIKPTAARVHEILSTSDADSDTGGAVAQGAGGRTVRVWGLPDWDTAETFEDVIMDGTDGTDTTNSYVIIHRMKTLAYGTSGPNVGLITAVAAIDATVTAAITIGSGQTHMAIRGIASTEVLLIEQYYTSIHDPRTPVQSAFLDVSLLVNESPQLGAVYISKHTQGVSTFGTSYLPHRFPANLAIQGPAIVKMQCTASAEDTDASAGFCGMIKTND